MSDRYEVAGHFGGWDIHAEGETLKKALLAYAAECRRDASAQQSLVERILDDAVHAEMMAAAINDEPLEEEEVE